MSDNGYNHSTGFGDYERTRFGGHRVIRVSILFHKHRDGVAADSLAEFALQIIGWGYTVRRNVHDGSRQCGIRARIVVVNFSLIISLDGDGGRRNLHISVHHFKCNIEISIIIFKTTFDTHVGCADIPSRRIGVTHAIHITTRTVGII